MFWNWRAVVFILTKMMCTASSTMTDIITTVYIISMSHCNMSQTNSLAKMLLLCTSKYRYSCSENQNKREYCYAYMYYTVLNVYSWCIWLLEVNWYDNLIWYFLNLCFEITVKIHTLYIPTSAFVGRFLISALSANRN